MIRLGDGLVGVRLDDGAAQTVAAFPGFSEAWFWVDIISRPIAVLSVMDQVQEIAYLIVVVEFGIVPHCLAVLRMRQVHTKLVIPGGLGSARQADMLASRGLDQAVKSVISVAAMRRDHLVFVIDGLLGIVTNIGNVAGGVVGIMQVLHTARWIGRAEIVIRK